MKVLVFGGSGKIGRAIAWDLAHNEKAKSIGLLGRNLDTLTMVETWINSDKIVICKLDIHKLSRLKKLMEQYDVGIIALPDRKSSYKVAEAAINAKLNIVDILEEYHRKPDPHETESIELPKNMSLAEYGESLHQKAIENDITFISGMGFAPGLSNITVGHAINQLDEVNSAIARVGGIPSKKDKNKHPLKYMITWAFEHVLREYMVKVDILKDGKIIEVDAMSEYEQFNFTELNQKEQLECFITPGMPSFLHTRPQLNNFAEKTIRWPGHYHDIQTLKDCGLLNLAPVNYMNKQIAPRDFLLSLIKPKLKPCNHETDICIMYNTVTGIKDNEQTKIEHFMWEDADIENDISSMARVTGYSAAIAGIMLGEGFIIQKGILAPEDCITKNLYNEFISELKKRDINILEVHKKI